LDTAYVQHQKEKQSTVATKHFREQTRYSIILKILELKVNGEFPSTPSKWKQVPDGLINKVRVIFGTGTRTIRHIWNDYLGQLDEGEATTVISMQPGSSSLQNYPDGTILAHDSKPMHIKHRNFNGIFGKQYDVNQVVELLSLLHKEKNFRITIDELHEELTRRYHLVVPRSIIGELLIEEQFVFTKSYVKPYLSIQHRVNRLKFVLNKLDLNVLEFVGGDKMRNVLRLKFRMDFNRLDADEKNFLVQQIKRRLRWRKRDRPETEV
jgi:hypothetical protein